MHRKISSPVDELAAEQAGVLTRGQLLRLGLTPAEARAPVDARRWQSLSSGVYLTHLGPLSPDGRVWAAVLAAGPGAVAGPQTSLWLNGLIDDLPSVIDVWVPHGRQARGAPGSRVRQRRALGVVTHPAARPPRLRLERAVLEAVREAGRTEAAVDVLIRAVQRRRTTPARLLAELERDRASPRRRLVMDVLSDVRAGVRSQLELRWVQRVERPHGLPRATLNAAEDDGGVRRYRLWKVVIELDGLEAHPREEAFRDRLRDNRVTVSGRVTLRYGWREVAGDPCAVAAEVATVLRTQGWRGTPIPCSPTCALRSWSDPGPL